MPDLQIDGAVAIETAPFTFHCAPPFITARFPSPRRTLGWTLLHPGFATVSDVVWVEVRNSDLTLDVDAGVFLRARLLAAGFPNALAFMTSRDVRHHHFATRRVETVEAACLTTIGLSNGERVGSRRFAHPPAGTINTLVHVSQPLTEGAFIEALAIAVQARTVAVLETRPLGDDTTGTGTDCVAIAAPLHGDALSHAGLHTALGEAIGGAVYDATLEGALQWNAEYARSLEAQPAILERRDA